jgi:hypothetical protein
MGQLPNFPILSQLADGDVNREYDCVPASIAAALEYFTRKHYTAGEVKDAVYGVGYQGGTAAWEYVTYCRSQGVTLRAIDTTDLVQLVDDLRAELAAGHPVLITEPDPYMPPGSGDTHVCVAYAWDTNSVTVMDPFIAAPITRTNAEWIGTLQNNEIWKLEAIVGIPTGWKDDGQALHNPYNDKVVVRGFRQYILNNAWQADNYPEENEQARAPLEDSNPGEGAGTQQVFRFSMLGWNTTQGVFVESVGQELAKCRAELAALRMVPVGGSDTQAKKIATQAIALLHQI